MQTGNKKNRQKQFLRKLLKWFACLLLLVLIVGYIVFKSSYVQTYICSKIGAYLSKKTETIITIEEVDFRPFDTFVFRNVLLLDHKKDTMLFSSNFYFEINTFDTEKQISDRER